MSGAVCLLILRVVLARPVPGVISERELLARLLSGATAFIVETSSASHMAPGLMPQ